MLILVFDSDVGFLLQSIGRKDVKQKMSADATTQLPSNATQRVSSRVTATDTVALMRQVLNLQDENDFSIVLAQAEKLKPGIIEWVTVYLQPRPSGQVV